MERVMKDHHGDCAKGENDDNNNKKKNYNNNPIDCNRGGNQIGFNI